MHSLSEKYQLKGQIRIRRIAIQTDRPRDGELYRCIAETRKVPLHNLLYKKHLVLLSYRLEAMKCGLPTFATNQGGPAQIIVDGLTVFHVDPVMVMS